MLERDGWRQVAQRGSHRQFRHPTKPGRVTVAGKPGEEMAIGTQLTEALDDTYRAAARPVRDTENSTIVAMTPSRSGTDLARRRSRPRSRTAK
jgi:predicted RNA binding protein YcfA (HicA-like mRNA interferase family)